jgi:hypothetical protein
MGGARLATAELSAVRTESINGSSICAPACAGPLRNSEPLAPAKQSKAFLLETPKVFTGGFWTSES